MRASGRVVERNSLILLLLQIRRHDEYPRSVRAVRNTDDNIAGVYDLYTDFPWTAGATVKDRNGDLIPLELDLAKVPVYTVSQGKRSRW